MKLYPMDYMIKQPMQYLGNEAATFIQVHPTFLYESMWNLALLLLIIFFFTKRKKFDGELIAIYCIGYGIGRFLIEGLRNGFLMIGSTGIRVSQILALILAVLELAGSYITAENHEITDKSHKNQTSKHEKKEFYALSASPSFCAKT